MAQTAALQYLIAIEMSNLRGLKDMNDYLMALKDFKDVEFNVVVNDSSLRSLTRQVRSAVNGGLRGGGGGGGGPRGGGGGYQSSSNRSPAKDTGLEKAIEALSNAVKNMARGTPPVANASPADMARGQRQQRFDALSPKAKEQALQLRAAAEKAVLTNKQLLDELDAFEKAKKTQMSPAMAQRMTRAYSGKKRESLQGIIANGSTDHFSNDAYVEFEEAMSPKVLREVINKRLSRLAAREAGVVRQPYSAPSQRSGGDPLGGELRVSFDATILSRAFTDGARLMAESVGTAMQTSSEALIRYLERAPSNPNPVSVPDMVASQNAVRPLQADRSIAEMRKLMGRYDDEYLNANSQLDAVGDQIAVRKRAIAAAKTPGVKTSASWLQTQEDELAELQRKQTRLQKDQDTAEKMRLQTKGTIAGLELGGMYSNAASAEQAAKMITTASLDPTSQSAFADRRASRHIAGLGSVSRDVFIDAMNSGVLALDTPPEQGASGRTKAQMKKFSSDLGVAKTMGNEKWKEYKFLEEQSKTEKDPAKLASLQQQMEAIGRVLDETLERVATLKREKSGAVFEDWNRTVQMSFAPYRAAMAKKRDAGDLTEGQYSSRIGSFLESERKYMSFTAGNPDVTKEMVLIPQALAQYVKETMKKYKEQLLRYAATGKEMDPKLVAEVDAVPLLKDMAGYKPENVAQANTAAARLDGIMARFNAAKTGFERFRPRQPLPLPRFNPNLSIDTVPMTEEEAGGTPYLQDQASRAAYLARFASEGGAFAPMSEERRAYTEKMLAQNVRLRTEQERKNNSGAMQETQKRIQAYTQELEFGGVYYKANALSREQNVTNGVLMSPEERKRVAQGGVASAALPNPFSSSVGSASATVAGVANPFQAQLGTATQFDALLINMEGHLARLSKTLVDLGKANFDPLVSTFEKINAALLPMADNFAKLRKDVMKVGSTIFEKGAIEEKRTAEIRQRKSIELETKRKLAEIRATYQGATDLIQEQKRLDAAAARLAAYTPISVNNLAPEEIVGVLNRSGKRAIGMRASLTDQVMSINSLRVNGLDTRTAESKYALGVSAYDATMTSYANAVVQGRSQGTRFENGRKVSEGQANLAEQLLTTQAQRNNVGGALNTLDANQALMENLSQQGRLNKRYGGSKEELARITKEYRDVVQANKVIYEKLVAAGTIKTTDISNLESVRNKHREITDQLGKQYDALMKNTAALRAVPEQDKTGLDGFASKLQRLGQYVAAGGVVYTVSNALRQAVSTAIDADSEVKRIQGILGTKSGGQAQDIVGGAYRAANDTGQSVKSALDMSRIFAQTGATAPEVQDLTKAALQGQVGAGLEGTQAADFLIAVRNVSQGQISPSDIIDRISRVESQYAVSARDLSVAIQRAGSLATQLQPQAKGAVSAIDLIIGSATAVIERTRVSGEQAATSLRFMFSRLLQPDVGRDLQQRFGVKLGGETPGSLRPLQDILTDIAGKYNDLNKEGRTADASNLLVTFAGARQANSAAALLTDFSKALEVARESSQAYGDTQQRVALQMDTIQAQYARLQTGLASMATAMLNDSGVAYIVKNVMGAAASGAEMVSGNGTGGFASTAAAITTTGALAYGAKVGLKRFAGTALAEGAGLAGVATVGAGGLATAGWGLLIYGVLELVGQGIKRGVELYKDKAAEDGTPFDVKTFRQSDFYKGVTEQAGKLGLSPEEMQRKVLAAVTATQVTLRAKYGSEVDNEKSPRANEIRKFAEEQLLKNLDTQIASFSSIGDRAAQLAAATAALTTNIKFMSAPRSEALSRINQESADFFGGTTAKLDAMTSDQEAKYSKLRKTGSGFSANRLNEMGEAISEATGGILDQRALGNTPFITKFGRQTTFAEATRYARPEEMFPKINQLARENLTLKGSAYDQYLQDAASKLTDSNQSYTQMDLVAAALNDFKESLQKAGIGATALKERLAAAAAAMPDAARIVMNQDVIVNKMLPGLMKQFNLKPSAAQSERDTAGIAGMDEESLALGTAYKQVMTRAAQRLGQIAKKELEGTKYGSPENTKAQEQVASVKNLQGILGRTTPGTFLEMFDPRGTIRTARERVLEPYIAYATKTAENNAMAGMQKDYGVDFDPMRAQYEAAVQFRQNQATVRPKLLGDLVRTGFKRAMVSGLSMEDATAAMQGMLPEEDNARQMDGLNLAGLAASAKATVAAKMDKSFQEQQASLRVQLVQEQKGLQGLADGFVTAGDKGQGAAFALLAKDMGDLITEMLGINPQAAGATDKIKSFVQQLKELQTQVEKTSEKGIRTFIENQRAIREDNRSIQRVQAEGERGTASLTSMNEIRMMQLQALGARPERVLAEQLRAQQASNAQQLAVLEAGYAVQMAAYERQLSKNPDNVQLKETIQDYNQTTAQRRLGLNQQGSIAVDRLQAAAITNVLQQQTQQLNAVFEGMMSPVKSFLMSSKNFNKEGLGTLASGLGNAAQEAIVNQFMERLQFLIQNPIVDSFRSGGMFSKQAIIDGFIEGSRYIQVGAEVPTSSFGGSAVTTGVGSSGGVFADMTDDERNEMLSTSTGMTASITAGGLRPGEGGNGYVTGPERAELAYAAAAVRAGGLMESTGNFLPLSTLANANVGGGKRGRFSFGNGKWGQAADAAGTLVGSLAGAQLAKVGGKAQNYGQEGASMGAMIGSMTPLGPIGGMIGGALGGLVGGMFGKDGAAEDTEALQKIERNTREQISALESQTQLLQLDSRFVNVPAGFTVPTYRPFGVGEAGGARSFEQTNNFEVIINAPAGMDGEQIARQVSSAIQRQLSTAGSSFDIRAA